MRGFLVALAEAIARALRGVWRVVDGLWKWVRTPFSPGSQGARENVIEPVEKSLEERLATWARDRAAGREVRLPVGITPAAAGWATRLNRDELGRVSMAPVDRIRAHLDGRAVIAGVRPAVVVELEDDQSKRLAALRARGAAMRAAVTRSLEASDRRRERADALAM